MSVIGVILVHVYYATFLSSSVISLIFKKFKWSCFIIDCIKWSWVLGKIFRPEKNFFQGCLAVVGILTWTCCEFCKKAENNPVLFSCLFSLLFSPDAAQQGISPFKESMQDAQW